MSKAKEKAREYVSQKLKENGYRNFHGTECVECAYISGYTQSVTDLSTENAQLREALRELVDECEFIVIPDVRTMNHLYKEEVDIGKLKYLVTKAKRLITYKEDK